MTRLEKVVLILALLSIPALTIRRVPGPKEPDLGRAEMAAERDRAFEAVATGLIFNVPSEKPVAYEVNGEERAYLDAAGRCFLVGSAGETVPSTDKICEDMAAASVPQAKLPEKLDPEPVSH